jgi:hypothetical protein
MTTSASGSHPLPPFGQRFNPQLPPHVAYQASLKALAKLDDRYRHVAMVPSRFDPTKVLCDFAGNDLPPSAAATSEEGSIFVYDLTSSGLQISVREYTVGSGRPLRLSSVELINKVLEFPRQIPGFDFLSIPIQAPKRGNDRSALRAFVFAS